MMPAPTFLTEEPPLPQTVQACHTVIRESWDLLHEMRQRLLVLEEQVQLNSRTSSKPPSSDGPGRGARPSKPKSGRKVGAQPGHKGSFRAMLPSDQVDQQVVCTPQPQCTLCHGDVIVDEDKAIRHQVFDLPPITPQVTEYLRLRGVCRSCGHKHQAHCLRACPTANWVCALWHWWARCQASFTSRKARSSACWRRSWG